MRILKIDAYLKNIFLVFAGASLANFLGLIYQLLVAHKLPAAEFAAFNSLLSVFMVISAPLGTFSLVVAKYSAEFNARGQPDKLRYFLSVFFKKSFLLAFIGFPIFLIACLFISSLLKINTSFPAILLAALLSLSCLPVFGGAIQGLELFGWQAVISVFGGAVKLALAFILINFGLQTSGALLALVAASVLGMALSLIPLRDYFFAPVEQQELNFREILGYIIPIALGQFCFYSLVNLDMVLVKHFFNPQDSGFYALAQMLGKIFLFLPGAITMVMFPRSAGLKARNILAISTLGRSLMYTAVLCLSAVLFYNLFPVFVLKVLTGKVYPESILLGRLFSISMSFFTLSYIIIM